jgi:hypothetical protein
MSDMEGQCKIEGLVCPWLRFVKKVSEEILCPFKEVVDGGDDDEGEDCGCGESSYDGLRP